MNATPSGFYMSVESLKEYAKWKEEYLKKIAGKTPEQLFEEARKRWET